MKGEPIKGIASPLDEREARIAREQARVASALERIMPAVPKDASPRRPQRYSVGPRASLLKQVYYARRKAVLRNGRRRSPEDAAVLVAEAELALALHDLGIVFERVAKARAEIERLKGGKT